MNKEELTEISENKETVNPTQPEKEKPIDLWIEDEGQMLSQGILECVNKSPLPLSVKKIVLSNLFTEIINTYNKNITAQREAYENQKSE